MRFDPPLIAGRLERRYKRFLADVVLEDGTRVTAHCPNSGSMRTCWAEGWPVRLSPASNPARKLKYTLEMTHNGRCWIGVNTQWPNALVAEAVSKGGIPELAGYSTIRREVPYGKNSRIDLLLEGHATRPPCHVEVKNTTLVEDDGVCRFPDAVTERGLKHLHELMAVVRGGGRAALVFTLQRGDGRGFGPASHIDEEYGRVLAQAARAGVELLPYRVRVTPQGLEVEGRETFDAAFAEACR
ncbi:MAG TPA: DNA/RNA nuclease SfsA [Bdellovibrionota bacterium]|nr:DNA/RNA nuclease SfsA [Bdellovibrionota bacterium]